MTIYFVRHGETTDNASKQHQGADAALSELGREQSAYLADRLTQFPIEKIVSSPFPRTKETAEIISQKINLPVQYTDQLKEILVPKEIQGKLYDDPESLHVRQLIQDNIDDPDWHYSDEENFYDFRARAKTFLESVENEQLSHILAVTHGKFLCAILGIMYYGARFNPHDYDLLRRFFSVSNTGISIAEWSNKSWQLKTWNDFAHLAELVEDSSHA